MKFVFAFLIFALLAVAGCTQQPAAPAPDNDVKPGDNLPPVNDSSPTGPGITERPDYLNASFFAELPPFPRDLYKLRNQIRYGEYWDLAALGPEYYKQPEFYPTFESIGLPLVATPSGYAPWGIGAYPGDIQVITFPGDNFTVATFFMSSWGVQTYQGLGFSPSVKAENGNVSAQEAASYFDVGVSPDAVYLGPSYPYFEGNWTNKVTVDVKVKPDAKPGTYYVDLNTGYPPKEMGEYWLSEFGGKYTEGGAIATGVGRPYFRITITIV